MAFSGYDASLNSTCKVYTLKTGDYVLVGTGTLARSGTAVVTCTFTVTGTFELAFEITSGAGLVGGRIVCGQISVNPAP